MPRQENVAGATWFLFYIKMETARAHWCLHRTLLQATEQLDLVGFGVFSLTHQHPVVYLVVHWCCGKAGALLPKPARTTQCAADTTKGFGVDFVPVQ